MVTLSGIHCWPESGWFRTQEGICGGLFVDRKAALRFAREENGYRPHAVVVVSSNLELDMSGKRKQQPPRGADVDLQQWRRSA